MPFAVQITNPRVEVRGVGPYTGQDIRSMMAKSHVCDFRQLGCPDTIFQSVLEKRAGRTGRSTPAPAQIDKKEWMALAFHALGQADVIVADRKRAEARVAQWNQARFDELKRQVRALEQPAKYFRTIEEVCAAQQRLREFLAGQ